MIRNTLQLLLFVLILIFTACNKQSQTPGAPDDSLDSAAREMPAAAPADNANLGKPPDMESIIAGNYCNFSISEFLQKGAGVLLDKKKSSFEVAQLIEYAKDPKQVIVNGKNFESFAVSEFIQKGAKVVVGCPQFCAFDIKSFISQAKDKSNVTVVACLCSPNDVLDFVQMGARIKINQKHEPFQLLSYIDAGKDLVEVDCRGYSSNWVLNFINRGATIMVDYKFNPFHIYEFALAGKERVLVNGYKMSVDNLEKFLTAGAKIVVGKFPKKCCKGKPTAKEPNSSLFTSHEITNLIKIHPERVTVIADKFDAHDVANFIQLGANVIFKDKVHDPFNINRFLGSATVPPTNNALSEKNKSGK